MNGKSEPQQIAERVALPGRGAERDGVAGGPVPSLYVAAMTDPSSVQGLMLANSGGYRLPGCGPVLRLSGRG